MLTTALYLALERYREIYNDYEIELLSAIDSLKRDYYRCGVINQLFKATFKSGLPNLQSEGTDQNLIVRLVEIQNSES